MVAAYNRFSAEKISQKIKKGCGNGELQYYKPWLNIHEFTSTGRSHRTLCNTSGRLLHLFSDLEFAYSCLFDWSENVSDIRERFPLVVEDVCKISEEAKIPILSHKSVPQIRFSDFLVADCSHPNRQYAVDIRYSNSLNTPSVLEFIELQRRYWSAKNIGFFVATERNLSKIVLDNLKWLLPAEGVLEQNSTNLLSQYEFYSIQMSLFADRSIIDFTKHIDTTYSMDMGESLLIFRKLLANRFIYFDLNKPLQNLFCRDFVFTRGIDEVRGFLDAAN